MTRKNHFLVSAFFALVFFSHSIAQETNPDYRLPIEISADALEVQQDKRVAVFTGNVRAIQGNIVLAADKISVEYADDGDETNTIRTIDAEGNVFFSTPTETAEGDFGTYDVMNGIITLNGSVILTQGNNILRGNSLMLNLINGVSRVEAAPDDGGRVRGLFVPKKEAEEISQRRDDG